MTTHKIEIEGLPEGWEPVAYRCAVKGENVLLSRDVIEATHDHFTPSVIVQKTKPRRIVLEETGEKSSPHECQNMIAKGLSITICGNKIWREVKEE